MRRRQPSTRRGTRRSGSPRPHTSARSDGSSPGLHGTHSRLHLHVVNVDDMVDVVVLEDDLLLLDERLLAGDVQGVEGGAEVRVDGLVAVVESEPVEADLAAAVPVPEDLDIGDVMAGPRLRYAGRA